MIRVMMQHLVRDPWTHGYRWAWITFCMEATMEAARATQRALEAGQGWLPGHHTTVVGSPEDYERFCAHHEVRMG